MKKNLREPLSAQYCKPDKTCYLTVLGIILINLFSYKALAVKLGKGGKKLFCVRSSIMTKVLICYSVKYNFFTIVIPE